MKEAAEAAREQFIKEHPEAADIDMKYDPVKLLNKCKRKIIYMCRSRGGVRGSRPPLKNHKNIGFLSNTGLDPLKITKLPSQHSILGHHQHTRETPFKWHFTGGPMMARLLWYLDPPSPHQPKKKHITVGPPPPPPPPPPH